MQELRELNLGFVTVLEENGGFTGGYLATNRWGRPLEFRLTTPVQPSRTQQILYGGTLKPYIHADLIGKALIEKAATNVRLIVADCEPLLDLRLHTETPVVWLAQPDDALAQRWKEAGANAMRVESGMLLCHPRFSGDLTAIRPVLADTGSAFDLAEPFGRILEALKEARKPGAAGKAA